VQIDAGRRGQILKFFFERQRPCPSASVSDADSQTV
jgi:hypothetical protein